MTSPPNETWLEMDKREVVQLAESFVLGYFS